MWNRIVDQTTSLTWSTIRIHFLTLLLPGGKKERHSLVLPLLPPPSSPLLSFLERRWMEGRAKEEELSLLAFGYKGPKRRTVREMPLAISFFLGISFNCPYSPWVPLGNTKGRLRVYRKDECVWELAVNKLLFARHHSLSVPILLSGPLGPQ